MSDRGAQRGPREPSEPGAFEATFPCSCWHVVEADELTNRFSHIPAGILTPSTDYHLAVKRKRLLVALASVFAGIAVLLAMLGIVYNLLIVVFAVPFGVAAYILWFHATGRLEARARRRRIDPRQRRADPRQQAAGGPRQGTGDPRFNGGWTRQQWPEEERVLSVEEAYRRLDLEPGADQERVRRAYRRKVKDVHPDREGGDQQAFQEVRQAYDRLSERP